MFWALPGGMAALVDALVGALAAAGVSFTAEAVVDVRDLAADGVVLATPAAATAALLDKGGASDAAAGSARHRARLARAHHARLRS